MITQFRKNCQLGPFAVDGQSRYRACIPQKWCRVLKATRNNPSTPSISEMNPPDELKHRTFLRYNHKPFKLQYFYFFIVLFILFGDCFELVNVGTYC